MKNLVKLLFPLLLPVLAVAQPNSGLEGKDVVINATEAVDICSGTDGVTIAVGCTGGGTTYKHQFATDGSVTLPGTLTVGQILGGNGTVALPSFASSGDLNTGVYFPIADQLGFVQGGTEAFRITSSALEALTGYVIRSRPGSTSVPSFGNGANSDTGVYFPTDAVGISVNAANVATFDSGGLGVIDGTAAAPSISFNNDTDTGIYLSSAETLAFSAAGFQRMSLTSSGVFLATPGSAAVPSIRIVDPTTGLYRVGANQIGVSANGSTVATFSSTGLAMSGGGSAAAPVITINDTDTGFLSSSAGFIQVSNNGTQRWSFRSDGSLEMATSGAAVLFRSPDGSYSSCTVDNSDVLTCTGL